MTPETIAALVATGAAVAQLVVKYVEQAISKNVSPEEIEAALNKAASALQLEDSDLDKAIAGNDATVDAERAAKS